MPAILGIKDGSYDASIRLENKDRIWVTIREFKQTYIILADDTTQTELNIRLTPGLPLLWQIVNGAVCITKDFKEVTTCGHPLTGVTTILWEATLSFTTNIDVGQNASPENIPPVVRWTGETEDELLEKDPITLEAIQTEANEALLTNAPIILPILEITRYEFHPFNPSVMLDFVHHTNSTVFYGAPVGSALMLPMEVDEEVLDSSGVSVKFVRVTYRIKFKIKTEGATLLDDTWKLRLLHHGAKYRPDPGDQPEAFLDKHKNPQTINLKTNKLHPGEGGTRLPDTFPAEYLEFNRFSKVNFNILSLGP